MGILEKISEIEKEIARTQKNKGKVKEGPILYYFFLTVWTERFLLQII